MSRFNTASTRPLQRQPLGTTGPALTHEGGAGFERDSKSALLMLAVVNMVGQDTFYESAAGRDTRYRDLVRLVAADDLEWMEGFVRWLRGTANMRSAALVAAAETVKARTEAKLPGGRRVVDAALQRADEPGELLGYWTGTYGRRIPAALKRGIGDACIRLYTEYALLKYDTASHGYRFADVLELCHVGDGKGSVQDITGPWQGDLFKLAIDRRHNRADLVVPASLRMVATNQAIRRDTASDPRALLNAARVKDAGLTWEDVLPLGTSAGLDKRELWEAVIPSMGYMALLRNLRNFDECGVSDDVAATVAARLADQVHVSKSRQFPFRFLSAYRAAPSLRWGHALEQALTAATSNIPLLKGRTLVLVDTSGSMGTPVSGKSQIRHVDVGALFGVALAARGADVDLVGYANGVFSHPLQRGGSVLRQTEAFCNRIGEVGHGTETVSALRSSFRGHDRAVVVTDGQAFRSWGGGSVTDAIPANVPLFGVDTAGYSVSSIDTSKPNRYQIGGFSDAMFKMMDLLSRGRDAGWPWE
jgi:hypothetical protein